MPRPDLDDLHRRHGTQEAQYIADFVRERGAHLVTCSGCGGAFVVAKQPTKREATSWRCGACQPREQTPMEAMR